MKVRPLRLRWTVEVTSRVRCKSCHSERRDEERAKSEQVARASRTQLEALTTESRAAGYNSIDSTRVTPFLLSACCWNCCVITLSLGKPDAMNMRVARDKLKGPCRSTCGHGSGE